MDRIRLANAMTTLSSVACAHANVALVKYFGKRNLALNLPAAGSLSLTLSPLKTTTKITFDSALKHDNVLLAKAQASAAFATRVERFLDLVRKSAKTDLKAHVETDNNFPTAAGLASSASGFAALAVAATKALSLQLNEKEMSALARRGSGSAARSIPGGIVVWNAGKTSNGSDSYAQSIASPDHWDLRMVIGITDPAPKAIGSTEAMELVRETSPSYTSWINETKHDLTEAVTAIKNRDLEKLGEITERSALSMHATALAAKPGIVFWNGATVDALRLIRSLCASGTQAYFTCDAGPQPKVLCPPKSEAKVVAALESLLGIKQTIKCKLASGANSQTSSSTTNA